MAKERKASVIYEGNGTQQTFSFPFDYLRKAFVKAEIIESSGITELEQGKDYSITDKELTLASGVSVATGKLLKIYRETTTAPLVEWQDASVLRSADLSLQEVQLLHLAEETADKVFDSGMSTAPTNTNVWDGQYKRITNLLDPQEDGDAVTLRYINNKQHGLITALKNEGATQDAGLKATGDSQNTRLTNTGNAQNTRLTTTGDTQNKRLTDTGDSYVATMTTLKADATTQANNATTKATEAKNSASSASSSASTATTKATEANNSANLSKAWAMSDSSPDGVSGNKSSKTWANEAKASETRASSHAHHAEIASDNAEDSATAAANSASAAAKSAENAKIWDPSSYYKKTETYNRAEVDNKIGSINKLPSNFRDVDGNICVIGETTGIVGMINNNGGVLGSNGANINIKSWNGVGFINGCPGFTTSNKVTVGISAREGLLRAHRLVATESIEAPNIYTKSEVDNKFSNIPDGMPTGTVLAFAGNTVPNNYLLCDGSAVSRSTYANLFKVIGTTYGAGNGSTTFNLPNLVDKFVEGSATAGTVKSAGLPNITGRISTGGGYGFDAIWNVDNRGAFNTSTASQNGWSAATTNTSIASKSSQALFDASLSNPIYGNSTTVQPPALTMRYIIKY